MEQMCVCVCVCVMQAGDTAKITSTQNKFGRTIGPRFQFSHPDTNEVISLPIYDSSDI